MTTVTVPSNLYVLDEADEQKFADGCFIRGYIPMMSLPTSGDVNRGVSDKMYHVLRSNGSEFKQMGTAITGSIYAGLRHFEGSLDEFLDSLAYYEIRVEVYMREVVKPQIDALADSYASR